MIEQRLNEILTSHDTAAILQLNCHRSPHVMHSLFNHHLTNKFSIIALQEPHINRKDYLPPNQANWILISPTPTDKLEAARPRACLYIRKDLQAAVNPIRSPSRNIESVITSCPPLKAPGSDKLQNWVWQMAWNQVKTHVRILFLQVT